MPRGADSLVWTDDMRLTLHLLISRYPGIWHDDVRRVFCHVHPTETANKSVNWNKLRLKYDQGPKSHSSEAAQWTAIKVRCGEYRCVREKEKSANTDF
jgi:hypothetical protein